ncbi:hypothetical protein HDE_03904 [Halotydeus destructor]|nr:hypothetical protein HDE_03904 [Halotydeus destructor]
MYGKPCVEVLLKNAQPPTRKRKRKAGPRTGWAQTDSIKRQQARLKRRAIQEKNWKSEIRHKLKCDKFNSSNCQILEDSEDSPRIRTSSLSSSTVTNDASSSNGFNDSSDSIITTFLDSAILGFEPNQYKDDFSTKINSAEERGPEPDRAPTRKFAFHKSELVSHTLTSIPEHSISEPPVFQSLCPVKQGIEVVTLDLSNVLLTKEEATHQARHNTALGLEIPISYYLVFDYVQGDFDMNTFLEARNELENQDAVADCLSKCIDIVCTQIE